jgi:hypothetical protein
MSPIPRQAAPGVRAVPSTASRPFAPPIPPRA